MGLLLLIGSSHYLVQSAVAIATALGINELLIGLTVVAIGTSLPELAACLAAARKGEPAVALGNIVGSSVFNALAVVGVAAVITPTQVPAGFIGRDLAMVIFIPHCLVAVHWTSYLPKDSNTCLFPTPITLAPRWTSKS